jgi:uncharacterized protein YbbK (DUF523 family)
VDNSKPFVGVSQCLLGDAVRYDGRSKPCNVVIDELCKLFELVAICPEVEAGLAIPRPPVQLTDDIDNPRLTGRDDASLDVTGLLQDFCDNKLPGLESLSGYIFKSQSPSCGLNSTPVFIDGDCVTESGRGIFARNLCQAYPDMPVIEETTLENITERESFIQRVHNRHQRLVDIEQQQT